MLNGLYSVYVQANTLFVVVFYILLLAFQQIPSEVEQVEVTRAIFFQVWTGCMVTGLSG